MDLTAVPPVHLDGIGLVLLVMLVLLLAAVLGGWIDDE